jgi:hypothetical protein
MQSEISAITGPLAELVLLTGCIYLLVPETKSRKDLLPAAIKLQERWYRSADLTPEAEEFIKLPPQVQKQVMDYARNWINANFERS